jgi:hypothetical protein
MDERSSVLEEDEEEVEAKGSDEEGEDSDSAEGANGSDEESDGAEAGEEEEEEEDKEDEVVVESDTNPLARRGLSLKTAANVGLSLTGVEEVLCKTACLINSTSNLDCRRRG